MFGFWSTWLLQMHCVGVFLHDPTASRREDLKAKPEKRALSLVCYFNRKPCFPGMYVLCICIVYV